MENDTLKCTIEYNDLVRILREFNCDCDESVVAEYLIDNIDYTFNLSRYIWDKLPFFVETFDDKISAIEYCKENYDKEHWKDCKIYECEDGSTYFEGC